MRICVVASFAYVAVGCVGQLQQLAQPAARGNAGIERPAKAVLEDDIREAVFRWQFAHNASALQQKAKAYYLSFGGGQDPGDAFIERFGSHVPPVKKLSQCETGGRGSQVKDRGTGERGLIFRVTKIVWRSGTEVEVTGGYCEANMSGSTIIWRVVREGGRWVVKEELFSEYA
ncbi:MAG: hypothetical protein ACYSU0_13065 [Planctomycetota bacterium]